MAPAAPGLVGSMERRNARAGGYCAADSHGSGNGAIATQGTSSINGYGSCAGGAPRDVIDDQLSVKNLGGTTVSIVAGQNKGSISIFDESQRVRQSAGKSDNARSIRHH